MVDLLFFLFGWALVFVGIILIDNRCFCLLGITCFFLAGLLIRYFVNTRIFNRSYGS